MRIKREVSKKQIIINQRRPEWIKVKEVAEMLKVSKSNINRVYKLINKGYLPKRDLACILVKDTDVIDLIEGLPTNPHREEITNILKGRD